LGVIFVAYPESGVVVFGLLLDDFSFFLLLLLGAVAGDFETRQILVGPVFFLLDAALRAIDQLLDSLVVIVNGLFFLAVLFEQLFRAESQNVIELLLREVCALSAHACIKGVKVCYFQISINFL
jgi:hypothetical protein